MLRRFFLILLSPIIFIVGLILCGYIIFGGGFSTVECSEKYPFRPFHIALFIIVMIVASLITSLYSTIGCIYDGNLDSITSFFDDISAE